MLGSRVSYSLCRRLLHVHLLATAAVLLAVQVLLMEVLQHLLLLLQLVVLLLQPVQLLQGDHGLRNIGCCLLGVIVGALLHKNRGLRLVWGFCLLLWCVLWPTRNSLPICKVRGAPL